MSEQVWWYVARASGLVAWALASASVVWGMFVSTRLLGKRPAAWLLDLHRWLGALTVTFTAVHLIGLMADTYVHFGVAELFVPFAARWRPGPVAWGIVAFYLLIAVQATSLLQKKLPRKVWLWVHRSSLILFVVGTIHALQAGTDLTGSVARITAIATSSLVLFLWLVRRWSPRGAARGHARAVRPVRPSGA